MKPNMYGLESYGAQSEDIERRRRYAEALQTQSMEPIQPSTAGGMTGNIHWTQGLAKMLQAYQGGKGQKKASEERSDLTKRMQEERSQRFADALRIGQGTPGSPSPPDGIGPAQPAQAGNPIGAYARLAEGGDPVSMQFGGQMLDYQEKDRERKALADAVAGPSQGVAPSAPGGAQGPGGAPGPPLTPQLNAPPAGGLSDYQGMAKEMRERAMRVMAINPAIGNHFLDSADRLEKMGMEKDVKPIVNENFPVSDATQQPHQYNRQTSKWEPIENASKRPIFNPRALVEQTIDLSGNEYSKKFGGGIAERDITKYDEAISAADGVGKLDALLSHLETSDAITGLGSDVLKNVERVKTLLLGDIKAGKQVSDTELLNAFLGSDVFPMIKALGIGARGLDTPAEREFLREVMSGTTAMNKQTLIKLAIMRRDIAVRAAERWNERLKTIPDGAIKGSGLSRDPIKIPERVVEKESVPQLRPYSGDLRPSLNWEELK